MFNPLDHQGIPLEKQVRRRRELNVDPIDPRAADPPPADVRDAIDSIHGRTGAH